MKTFTGVKCEYYSKGYIESKAYYENGKLHRIDGPAVILYHESYILGKIGNVFMEIYYVNGNVHRIGGPAIIVYNKYYQTIVRNIYFENDNKHRIDGPAEILYDVNGKIGEKIYYKNRTCMTYHMSVSMKRGNVYIKWYNCTLNTVEF